MGLNNVTFDDVAGEFSYSGGWRAEPSPDADFFQGTYHASQSENQTLSFTFTGSGCYIYGSKGATYGNFKVQRDNFINLNSSVASGSTPVYQQLLWGSTFPNGTHFIELTTLSAKWVDVDFILLTVDGPDDNPDPGSFPTTVSGITSPVTSSSSMSTSNSLTAAAGSTPSSSNSSPSTQSSHNSSVLVPTAVAGVLGGLLLLVLGSLIAIHLLRRRRRQQLERERAFRSGNLPPIVTRDPREKRGLLGGIFNGGLSSGSDSGRSGTPLSGRTQGTAPYSMNSPGGVQAGRIISSNPYGTSNVYDTSRGGGAPGSYGMVQNPRHSIDFLSVRS